MTAQFFHRVRRDRPDARNRAACDDRAEIFIAEEPDKISHGVGS